LRRAGGAPAREWVAAARTAALAGYGPVDAELLRSLEVCKECSEVLYAQRTVPEWIYAPLAGLRELLVGERS
jgi:predicted trehalose synthase